MAIYGKHDACGGVSVWISHDLGYVTGLLGFGFGLKKMPVEWSPTVF
jgi:hypothetical protein